MKMTELSAYVDELREQRAALHAELTQVLADDSMPQGEARKREAEIRAQVADINLSCYPAEIVRGKLPRVLKGTPLGTTVPPGGTKSEKEIFDECMALVEEQHGKVEVG